MSSAGGVSDVVGDGEAGQWDVYWTTRGVEIPRGRFALLDAWADIDARERTLSIEPGTPILINPRGRVDPLLSRFMRRSRFSRLAHDTRVSYVKDYRLFFSYLWTRGKNWDEADAEDIDDYEAWRRRSKDNPRRISGAKWDRELAAFLLLYKWAVANGHMATSPVTMHTTRTRDGSIVEVPANRAKDVRVANVKWYTPRTLRLWRDVGLRGYSPDGLPEQGWRGRNDGRNSAFADLLIESGLRLREGGCLLTLEVPDAVLGHSYYEGTVAAAIAKRRERMFYVHADALKAVEAYTVSTRRAAIRRAQLRGAYDRLRGKLVVTKISGGRRRLLSWEDSLGNRSEAPVNAIDAGDRARLFIVGENGLEPLQLWLTEGGLPMAYESWEKVFDAANERCARYGLAIQVTPHICRHSFALKMLITLKRGLDLRYGLDPDERTHLRKVYGEVFPLVKDLLGHKSETTTRMIYLEPLNGIRLAMILDGTEDLSQVFTKVAASSRLVIDVEPDGWEG
ncbi:site-specific integrase [Actinomadura sp. NPDC048032]|uniref:site-specific integrase n=1 Tax=Actinomadura sp. NPDC048032 TaxID=3155747 RepID=UPI0033E39DA7